MATLEFNSHTVTSKEQGDDNICFKTFIPLLFMAPGSLTIRPLPAGSHVTLDGRGVVAS